MVWPGASTPPPPWRSSRKGAPGRPEGVALSDSLNAEGEYPLLLQV